MQWGFPIYVHIIYMILQDNYKERRQGREGEMLVLYRTGGQDFLNLTFIGKMSYLTDISSLFSSNSRQQYKAYPVTVTILMP